jgi:hypothetical protein
MGPHDYFDQLKITDVGSALFGQLVHQKQTALITLER